MEKILRGLLLALCTLSSFASANPPVLWDENCASGIFDIPTAACLMEGGGGVNSLHNSDGTLTIAPSTGTVTASLNLGHANTWTGKQTYSLSTISITGGSNGNALTTNGSGTLSFTSLQSPLTFTDSIVNTGGTVTLVGDSASPGNSQYYGTNGVGSLGYYALPSTSPGGVSTNIQYNNSGAFGGLAGSAVDPIKGFMGVNQGTPSASVDAGIYAATVSAPASLSVTGYTVGVPNGYAMGTSGIAYTLYSKQTINSTDFYSSSGASASANIPAAGGYDPSAASAAINLTESGYTASGYSFTYDVFALYPNSSISVGFATTNTVTDDNGGEPYGIDLTWTAPVAAQAPIGYLLTLSGSNPNAGQSQVVSGTSFTDTNTGWGSNGPFTTITAEVNLSWPAVTGATDYVLNNTFATQWSLTGNVTAYSDNNTGTSGSPTLTPTSYNYPTLNSEGTTSLVSGGAGLLGFFGTAPVAQQTGDVVAGLQNSGLMSSGLYNAALLDYNGNPSHPIFSGYDILYADGSIFGDMNAKSFTFGGGYTFDGVGNLSARKVVIGNQISPSSPTIGQIYWSSSGGSLNWYNGSDHTFLLDSVALGSQVTGTLPLNQGGNGKASSGTTNFTGQTAANSSVAAVASAGAGTYRVGGYLTITAVSLDVIQLQVTYTDETSTVRTQLFFPQGLTSASLATTGAYTFPPMDIRVKNATAITAKTVLTTGTGSISYDVGATIFRLE